MLVAVCAQRFKVKLYMLWTLESVAFGLNVQGNKSVT